MAVTLNRLCEKANYLYGMRLLAGTVGINRPVQWVHVVEDVEAASFLHGGELIFTTGIAQTGTGWLLAFAKELFMKGVSGLVVNRGPYLGEMPEELLDFCNEKNFPLMEVPWKTRLVDITRDFCNQIIRQEKEEEDIGTIFKNLMYYPEELPRYLPALENHNFNAAGKYRLVGIWADCPAEQIPERLRQIRQLFFSRLYDTHIQPAIFEGKESLYVVLENTEAQELRRMLPQMQRELEGFGIRAFLTVGEESELKELPGGFRRVTAAMRLAEKRGVSPLFYEDLGVEKILISVDDPRVLEEFTQSALGHLESYDRDNGTHFVDVLKTYLAMDGSVQKVAEAEYVHRNTVNYQIGRIKKILDRDLGSMEERLSLMLAFRIQEIL